MRLRQNAESIFKCILLNEKPHILIEISLKFVPQGAVGYMIALVQVMACHLSCDKPLPESIMSPSQDLTVLLSTPLTHWGRVTHICISKLTNTGSDNGLPPGRHQAIIWTNAGLSLIKPLRTNFSEILIEIYTLSFKKMQLKMSSGKWRPFCPGLNLLKYDCLPDIW